MLRVAPPTPLLHRFPAPKTLARSLRPFRFSHLQCGLTVFFFQFATTIYVVGHNLCYPFCVMSAQADGQVGGLAATNP